MNTPLLFSAIAAALILTGCGTLSQVDSQGHTNEPVFPKPEDVTLHTGTYPNLDNLRQIHDGMTRDQLYDLVGRPHFSEGFKVREWDYLFHFHTAEGVRSCQYKVLFDKDLIARNFYWQPADCAQILDAPAQPAPAQTFSLSGDVSFAFGSATLSAAGLNEVARIADELKSAKQIDQVTVSGHTDRIGSAAANQQLSQQRAMAVRQALVDHGLPAASIQARGFGDSQAVVECHQGDRNALIACLAPNRRVDIEVTAR